MIFAASCWESNVVVFGRFDLMLEVALPASTQPKMVLQACSRPCLIGGFSSKSAAKQSDPSNMSTSLVPGSGSAKNKCCMFIGKQLGSTLLVNG